MLSYRANASNGAAIIPLHDVLTRLRARQPLPCGEPAPKPKRKRNRIQVRKPRAAHGTVFHPDDTIRLLADHNPKRPDSIAAARFAAYRDQMTVRDYEAALGSVRAARECLRFDLHRRYISIVSNTLEE
jgi:hypothetical protein